MEKKSRGSVDDNEREHMRCTRAYLRAYGRDLFPLLFVHPLLRPTNNHTM